MILDDIVAVKKERLIEQKKEISLEKMMELAKLECEEQTHKKVSFYDAIKKAGLSIIGEFKKASPSHGKMNSTVDLVSRIKQYNASVDCISCLTEEHFFNGGISYFKEIREMSNLPMIRKDFIIDPYQIYEAKVIGADCILLIAAILTDAELKEFKELAESLDLDILLETHDEEEMRRAIAVGAKMIGINNRDLRDFTVHLETTARLSKMVPAGTLLVSESGVSTDEDIRYLQENGINAMLIGTALMEAKSPEETAKHWKDVYAGK